VKGVYLDFDKQTSSNEKDENIRYNENEYSSNKPVERPSLTNISEIRKL
jgi:hypothetical protein